MLLHDQVFHVEARGDVFKISAVWMRMDKGSAHPFVKIVCSSAKVVLKKA